MKFLNPFFIIFLINLFIIFFTYIKMFKTLSAKYYQENKERLVVANDIKILRKKACDWYHSKEWFGHESFKHLSEDENERLVEYRKKHYRVRTNTLL